jgi:tripartite-type tricarboxylate transporter receptor subunit TctC
MIAPLQAHQRRKRVKKFTTLLALTIALSFAAFVANPCAAQTDAWPSKPVRVIVPFAAGGAADILARIVSDHLGRVLGQSFVIDNRAGAGGLVGEQAGARSDPDGYTFVVSGIAPSVIAPAMSPTPTFDPLKDFTHIAYLGGPPLVLLVHPSLGVKTFAEFLALIRSRPEGLGYVSPGTGTHGHLFAEYLAQKEHIKLEHVPYKGSAPALIDLIAGHVKVGTMAWVSAAEEIRTGALRVLAVSSEARVAADPSVPTFKELGYPDLVAATWFGISGPAGVSLDIAQKLNGAVTQVLQLEDVKKRFAQDAVQIVPMTPQQYTAFIGREMAIWQPLAKTLNKQVN